MKMLPCILEQPTGEALGMQNAAWFTRTFKPGDPWRREIVNVAANLEHFATHYRHRTELGALEGVLLGTGMLGLAEMTRRKLMLAT